MQYLLALFLVLCAGCAQLKTTITETEPAKAGKPARTTKLEVHFSGTSGGARDLLDAETRRVQTLQSGDVAQPAIAKGMPATLGQDAARSDVQAGYTYGYGAYGTYGANPYGVSPALMAAEAASLGYMPGQLPRLGEVPVSLPTQPQAAQASGGGKVTCPRDRVARTTEERLACNENDIDVVTKKVFKKK